MKNTLVALLGLGVLAAGWFFGLPPILVVGAGIVGYSIHAAYVSFYLRLSHEHGVAVRLAGFPRVKVIQEG